MIAAELVQAIWVGTQPALDALALVSVAPDATVAPTVIAAPEPSGIDTEGVVTFFASKIAPILLAVLGVIFIGRASRGEISKVLTSSAIAIVGLAFIAGAATLFFVGEYIIGLIFE
jgi:hypothetical protein